MSFTQGDDYEDLNVSVNPFSLKNSKTVDSSGFRPEIDLERCINTLEQSKGQTLPLEQYHEENKQQPYYIASTGSAAIQDGYNTVNLLVCEKETLKSPIKESKTTNNDNNTSNYLIQQRLDKIAAKLRARDEQIKEDKTTGAVPVSTPQLDLSNPIVESISPYPIAVYNATYLDGTPGPGVLTAEEAPRGHGEKTSTIEFDMKQMAERLRQLEYYYQDQAFYIQKLEKQLADRGNLLEQYARQQEYYRQRLQEMENSLARRQERHDPPTANNNLVEDECTQQARPEKCNIFLHGGKGNRRFMTPYRVNPNVPDSVKCDYQNRGWTVLEEYQTHEQAEVLGDFRDRMLNFDDLPSEQSGKSMEKEKADENQTVEHDEVRRQFARKIASLKRKQAAEQRVGSRCRNFNTDNIEECDVRNGSPRNGQLQQRVAKWDLVDFDNIITRVYPFSTK